MFDRSATLRGVVLLTGVSVFSAVAWAGSAEISGFGGGTTLDAGGGTHGVYGAAAAYRLGDHVHLFGEFSFSNIASSTSSSNGTTITANVNLRNFGGGVDYGFGSSTSKLRPYVLAAFGDGDFYGTGSGVGNGTSVNVSLAVTNSLYVGVGGGIRLYVGKHWGFKPEVRYQRYQSSLIQSNTVVYTGGIFWQFGQ